MTNYDVIQTMTAKELANWLKVWMADEWGDEEDIEKWLRSDSQQRDGLLTDNMKKYWKVH